MAKRLPVAAPARQIKLNRKSSTTSLAPRPPRSNLALAEKNAKKPPKEAPSDNINQYPYLAGPDPISGWSVPLLTDALSQHQRGLFQQSGVLADDMAANPWINHCLERRAEFFTTTALNVTPAGRGDARRCADFIREVLPDILPLTILKDLHRQFIMMGQAVAVMDWAEYRDGADRRWLPRLKPWQPQLTYYQQFVDADSVDMGALVATTLNRGLVRIDAGESRWVVFSQSRLKSWMRGAVRTLGEAYLGDTYNFRDNMAFQDKFGRGIYLLHHPVSWKDEEIIAAVGSLRYGGGGGVFPCPTGPNGAKIVDLDLVRADGTGFKTFDATEDRVKTRIFITLLGQNMTSEGATGGFAQARVHEHGLWRIFENDAAYFGDATLTVSTETQSGSFPQTLRQWQPRNGVIRSQISKWIALWNFGDMDLAPYVWWNATQPEDVREQQKSAVEAQESTATAMASVAAAIDKLNTAGQKYDAEYLFEQAGVRLRREIEGAANRAVAQRQH